jgi:hypothetical protein
MEVQETARNEPRLAAHDALSNQAVSTDPAEYRHAARSMQAGGDTAMNGFPSFEKVSGPDGVFFSTSETANKSPRESLLDALKRSQPGAESLRTFQSNLDSFEADAAKRGLSPQAVSETFRQMGRILNASNATVPPELRRQFVTQWASKLADPESVKQGWHDTCGMAAYQTYALLHHPEALTRSVADALTGGSTQVPDDSRNWLALRLFNQPEATGTRTLAFDKKSFQPDWEAQGKSPHADARDYADQVAQVVLNSFKWDMRETNPDGLPIPQGRMKFKQCETVERPADTMSGPGGPRDRSCESVEETSLWGSKKTYDGDGYGFGGQSTAADMSRVHFALTGKLDFMAIDRTSGFKDAEQFETLLNSRQSQNRLPLGIFVSPSHPEFAPGYLARHPEKTEVSPNVMLHIVGVTKVNADGTVDIVNSWGLKHRMTTRALFDAMH